MRILSFFDEKLMSKYIATWEVKFVVVEGKIYSQIKSFKIVGNGNLTLNMFS